MEDISKMADSIILLEERKEVTTFLLDEGTIILSPLQPVKLQVMSIQVQKLKLMMP